MRSVGLENWLRDDGGKRKSEREKVVIVNGKKLVGLAVARRNCRGGNERREKWRM